MDTYFDYVQALTDFDRVLAELSLEDLSRPGIHNLLWGLSWSEADRLHDRIDELAPEAQGVLTRAEELGPDTAALVHHLRAQFAGLPTLAKISVWIRALNGRAGLPFAKAFHDAFIDEVFKIYEVEPTPGGTLGQ